MYYLFFDLEYANSSGGTIKPCEFGYVVTDQKFNITDRGNFIINPELKREEWDSLVLETILTRPLSAYEVAPAFPFYYERIRDLILGASFIAGHSLSGDCMAINDACVRYDLPSIDYDFYDIKPVYKKFTKSSCDTSVVHMMEFLKLEGDEHNHDAEADSYNTMLIIRRLLVNYCARPEQLARICPASKDRTENYCVVSIAKSRARKAARLAEYNATPTRVAYQDEDGAGTSLADILKTLK